MTVYSRRSVLKLGSLVGGGLLSRRGMLGLAFGDSLGRGLASGEALRRDLASPRLTQGANAEPDQEGLFAATELLTRPTDRTVTLNLVPAVDLETYVELGQAADEYAKRTPTVSLPGGKAAQVHLDDLPPNSPIHYRLRYRRSGAEEFTAGREHRFHTQRAVGSDFVFAVQADSHLGTAKHCDPALYTRTLQNIARYEPDLFIDLGDTFRATKLKETSREAITRLYLSQREFLGQVADAAPLFLVNGNHEMEWGWLLDDTPDSVPAMCALARKTFYPQPERDAFFGGDEEPTAAIGMLQDYYAWHWGDALFVVIDPYWHTPRDPGGAGNDKVSGDDSAKDPWTWTLGDSQYRWFQDTLASSPARYKFVFHHHVLGACRGGVEWAPYYEWGGHERNGADTFRAHRPGWDSPIHPLMARHGVTIFFQGHDHLFVRQELDGIVYQTVPMAGDPSYSAYNQEAYHSGDILPNTGHLRVAVSPEKVTVDYIRSFLPVDEKDGHTNGEVAFTYTVASRQPPSGQPPAPTSTPSMVPSSTPLPAPTSTPSRAWQRIYMPLAQKD